MMFIITSKMFKQFEVLLKGPHAVFCWQQFM